MRRCTSCFRFHAGNPTFCSHCGRSFNVRICPRGHHNPRGVTFCSECGSAELSTPAPPASFLHWFSGIVLYTVAVLFVCLLLVSLILSFLQNLDLNQLAGPLVMLAIMLGLLYWTTTLLPGPVKKVGHAAGRLAWKVITNKRKK